RGLPRSRPVSAGVLPVVLPRRAVGRRPSRDAPANTPPGSRGSQQALCLWLLLAVGVIWAALWLLTAEIPLKHELFHGLMAICERRAEAISRQMSDVSGALAQPVSQRIIKDQMAGEPDGFRGKGGRHERRSIPRQS